MLWYFGVGILATRQVLKRRQVRQNSQANVKHSGLLKDLPKILFGQAQITERIK